MADSQCEQASGGQYGEWLRTKVVKGEKSSNLVGKRDIGTQSFGGKSGALLDFEGVVGVGLQQKENQEEKGEGIKGDFRQKREELLGLLGEMREGREEVRS